MVDSDGNEIELTTCGTARFSTQPTGLREDAWKGLFSAYKTLNHAAANYEGHVKAVLFRTSPWV